MSGVAMGALLSALAIWGLWQRVPMYDAFIRGAREGLETAMKVAPCLIAIVPLCALLQACGVMERVCDVLAPVAEEIGVSKEILPLMLMRPLSGSASLGLLERLLAQVGPDSHAGRVASVVCGANETIFYLCALYLGSIGVRRSRYILPAALAGYLAACVSAGTFCALFK